MLTNDSVLVKLYYYSNSTSHIQAIPQGPKGVFACTNSTSHVRKSEGRASIPSGVSTSTDVPRTRVRYLTTSYASPFQSERHATLVRS